MPARQRDLTQLQERKSTTMCRLSSSLYSSYASSSHSAAYSLERQPRHDPCYCKLVALRLNQLLTSLAFLLARRDALEKDLQAAKRRYMDIRWEIFAIDPDPLWLGGKAVETAQADPGCKLTTSERRALEVAKDEFDSSVEQLERKLLGNQKSIDDGLGLLWRLLEEMAKIKLDGEQRQNAGLQDGGLLDGETVLFDTGPGGTSHVDQISRLLYKCSLVELREVQKVIDKVMVPGLRTQMTQDGLMGPTPARATPIPPWV
ncbi:hypothetical protein GQ53DRAFT_287339 [Thozetella sp. PMI_491]|nr:hypothetical protein GQ53DRAFT_287339 [Thozetella sp. PMI_491]